MVFDFKKTRDVIKLGFHSKKYFFQCNFYIERPRLFNVFFNGFFNGFYFL